MVFEEDFPNINLINDLVQSLPPTSIEHEDTTLNSLMQIKLLSSDVADFDPKPVIDYWLCAAERPHGHRRVNYARKNVQEGVSVVASTSHVELEEDESSPSETDILNAVYCGVQDDDSDCVVDF
ncbi:hypothetical protein DPMN_038279 [Dreissena polymorpha]|uniref:Uncharacterized protein n=1 Tax=Dreissena polymorpha TaxID=45954 RepID=A0A9D4MF45_DREPO|nr:hypothetical protein DPMN_038279 [Dreissena polymorpha]